MIAVDTFRPKIRDGGQDQESITAVQEMGQSDFEFQFSCPPFPLHPAFRLFTKESITKIRKKAEEIKSSMKSQTALSPNIADAKTEEPTASDDKAPYNLRCLPQLLASMLCKCFGNLVNSNNNNAGGGNNNDDTNINSSSSEDDEFGPNPSLEAGKHLPSRMGEFPPELYGKPIEDVDEFYNDKPTFMVVARDKTIFRFSATDGLFFFSPFNPVRRVAIYIITHPCFSLLIMTVILVNCVYMATNQEIPDSEAAFTGIYTIESTIKILARGLILGDFTYLRDVWNWLDFIVVSLAYITIAFPVGNLAVLRTFRVLRALKTVAVVPGLKTIVGALMEAVRRLRDVMILTIFVLSIFALVGLQIYQGTLKNKCVRDLPFDRGRVNNSYWTAYTEDKRNWFFNSANNPKICGNGSESGKCPLNYTCLPVGPNPNYGYTNFDNYGYAMLCAFRLMTQDCWENLYQMVLTANGPYHIIFFIIVIFLGSFYLVNLILAIVAMSYDDCQKMDKEEEEAEAILDKEIRRKSEQDCNSSVMSRRDSPQVLCQVKKQSVVYTKINSAGRITIKDEAPSKPRQNSIVSAANQTLPVTARPVISIQSYNDSLKAFIGVDFPFVDDSLVTTPADVDKGQSGEGPVKSPPPDDNSGHVSEDSLLLLHPPYQHVRSSSLQVTIPDGFMRAINNNNSTNNRNNNRNNNNNSSFHSIDRLVVSGGQRRACFKQLEKIYPAKACISPRSYKSVPRHSLATPYLIQRFYGSKSAREPADKPPPPPLLSSPPLSSSTNRRGSKSDEPTHFRWVTILDSYGRRKSTFPVSSSTSQRSCLNQSSEGLEDNRTGDNRRLSSLAGQSNALKFKDVEVLKNLLNKAASPKKASSSSSSLINPAKNRLNGVWERLKSHLLEAECSPCWLRAASSLEQFILDPFVDLFITVCIVLNTVFMAMDHAGMKDEFARTLIVGNYVFTTIFTAEALLKILAVGLFRYVRDKWNCFDIIIVLLSLVELGLSNVKGLSILRSFRLLRVFKLAKSWPTLNLLIGIIGRTMGALGNLCFVLAIIIFIFAVMGMQLFGEKYTLEKFSEIPRWNFKDFLHSFMIVFRVLCGEWVESMWNCIHCSGVICIPFFLLTMIIGNLVVLNLFLALLLSSFGAESLQTSQDEVASEANKLQEAVDRIARFAVFLRSRMVVCFKTKVLKRDKELHSVSSRETGTLDRSGAGGGGKAWSLVKPQFKNLLPLERMNLTLVNQNATDKRRASYQPNSIRQTSTERNHAVTLMNGCVDLPHRQFHGDYDVERGRPSPLPCSEENGKAFQPPSITFTHSPNTAYSSSSSSTSSFSESNFYSPHSSKATSCASMKISFSCDDDDDLSNNFEPHDMIPEGPEVNEVNVVFIKYPDECCPKCILDGHLFCCWKRNKGEETSCCQKVESSSIGRCFWKLRCMAYSLVEHRYFETFIIVMILSSSITLAVEDKNIEERKSIKNALKLMDKIFSIIFLVEMFLKQLAYGFHKYFTDAWCWLDFIIVLISIVSLGAEGAGMGNMGAFRALRTLRALRPLRAVSRWEGMKVVVNALIQAIPAICNVLLVCLVFWLIFSIMGVNLFGGRYAVCVDSTGSVVNSSIVANESQCLDMKHSNYSWTNPHVNFDHVPVAYLALFQVATFKGWTDIMNRAVDCKEQGQQPERESKVYMYLYFVFFIVFGSFFTLNLFIGVIIDNFNMQKRKAGGSIQLFMTEDQKKYYNAMKKLGSKQPQKPIPKPRFKCSMFMFRITTNQKFDVAIMSIILLNMLTMTMEHYNQPDEFATALGIVNSIFISIFTIECLMKLIALRIHYFKQPWNVFDFCVVVMSILGLAMKEIIEQYLVSPTLLRVVRVFRVGRILRLVKSAKGIRTLLFSLAVSLPALFNIGLLLFLIMFIYAIFGMSFFMHVRYNAGIEELFNFETFGRSMTLLFQISTSAGWDMVLAGLTIEPPHCNATFSEDRPTGDCGNKMMGIMYLVTYLVISFLVVVNMYIAVILENFSQATEDVQQGLTQDDFDMYYEIWERFDEKATQHIPLSQLSTFVDALEKPLRIPIPNAIRLTYLDIPICEGERIHCVDILDALAKNYLAWNCYQSDLQVDLKNGPERKDYHPISSTMKRKRQEYCAAIIQRFWRNYKSRESAALAFDDSAEDADDSDTSYSRTD